MFELSSRGTTNANARGNPSPTSLLVRTAVTDDSLTPPDDGS